MVHTQAGSEKEAGEEAADREAVALLREVRGELARLYHDANNPLAIISGNAQFLLELSKAMNLDADLVQPIQDIDEACRRVAEKLRDLTRLRDRVARFVEEAKG